MHARGLHGGAWLLLCLFFLGYVRCRTGFAYVSFGVVSVIPAKRLKLSSTSFAEQQPLDVQGAYLRVQEQKRAGFSSDASLIFVREESVDLWQALQTAFENGMNISVDGPPGTGKSTETWAWSLWMAVTNRINVTWFHLSKMRGIKVLINGALRTITSGYSAEIGDIKNSEGALLVVDGLTEKESIDINRACSAWRQQDEKNRRFVTVSSMSVTVALEQYKEANMVNFTVGSWTFEQYECACQDQNFYVSIKDKLRCPGFEQVDGQSELLLSKYIFAGGCARWMFEFDYEEWKSDFTKHFQKVSSYKNLFLEVGGDETKIAVNHLRGVTVLTVDGRQETKYFFISQHAARQLANKCSDKRRFLIDSYKKAAETKNPAFGGWIFEFDVDYQLQDACNQETMFHLRIRDGDDEVEERRLVSSYVEFAAELDLVTPIRQLAVDEVLWAKPALWCQKAYDFLCFWKEGTFLKMVAANASHAKTHSVMLHEVNRLAAFLGSNGCVVAAIRFDFLVPSTAQFRVGVVVGQLTGWKNLKDVDWPNTHDAAAYVAGAFVVVADVDQTAE